MAAEDRQTFSTAEVCRAVGLLRSTFDAWLLRQYMPVPPGPGTGRSRTYTFLDAVRIAVAAELNRLGIAAAAASRAASRIEHRHLDGQREGHAALVLAASLISPSDEGPTEQESTESEITRGPAIGTFWTQGPADLERMLHRVTITGFPASYVFVDIAVVATRTRTILDDPGRADELFLKLPAATSPRPAPPVRESLPRKTK